MHVDLTQKLTLTMSACALAISSVVAWQTYRSGRVNEATNRAIITVDSARMTTFKRGGGEILLTLENSGKALAQNVKVKYLADVVLPMTRKGQIAIPTYSDDAVEYGNIAPSKKGAKTLIYKLPTDNDLPMLGGLVVLGLKIRYTDEATNREYLEQQSLSGLLSGKTIVTPEMLPEPIPTLEAMDKLGKLVFGEKLKPKTK
jgi:hypothetical protein